MHLNRDSHCGIQRPGRGHNSNSLFLVTLLPRFQALGIPTTSKQGPNPAPPSASTLVSPHSEHGFCLLPNAIQVHVGSCGEQEADRGRGWHVPSKDGGTGVRGQGDTPGSGLGLNANWLKPRARPWSVWAGGLTGRVEGGSCAVSTTVLHGKHLHELLLEDGQQVGDAVVQAHVKDKLDKRSGRR